MKKVTLVVVLLWASLTVLAQTHTLVRGDSVSTQAFVTPVIDQALYAGRDGILFLQRDGAEYVSFDGKKVVNFWPSIEGELVDKKFAWSGQLASDGIDVYFVMASTSQDRKPGDTRFYYYLARYGLDGKYKGLSQIQHDFDYCCQIAALGNNTLLLSGTMLMRDPNAKNITTWSAWHLMPFTGEFGTDGGHMGWTIDLPGDDSHPKPEDILTFMGGLMDRDDYGNVIFVRRGITGSEMTEPKAWIISPGQDPEQIELGKLEPGMQLRAAKLNQRQLAVFYCSRNVKENPIVKLSIYDDHGRVDRTYTGNYSEMGRTVVDWNPVRLLMASSATAPNGEKHIELVEWLEK